MYICKLLKNIGLHDMANVDIRAEIWRQVIILNQMIE